MASSDMTALILLQMMKRMQEQQRVAQEITQD